MRLLIHILKWIQREGGGNLGKPEGNSRRDKAVSGKEERTTQYQIMGGRGGYGREELYKNYYFHSLFF